MRSRVRSRVKVRVRVGGEVARHRQGGRLAGGVDSGQHAALAALAQRDHHLAVRAGELREVRVRVLGCWLKVRAGVKVRVRVRAGVRVTVYR